MMHEQKHYQQLYFELPIKVIAASTSSKKMFPAPSVYCTANLSGSLSRKSLSEEQKQKAKGLREVDDVPPPPQQAGMAQAAHPTTSQPV